MFGANLSSFRPGYLFEALATVLKHCLAASYGLSLFPMGPADGNFARSLDIRSVFAWNEGMCQSSTRWWYFLLLRRCF